MINNLHISNFKSIKSLNLACKRVNLFIGDPNSGKSNILEALSMLTLNSDLRNFIRFENASQLFNDFDPSRPIGLKADDHAITAAVAGNTFTIDDWLGSERIFQVQMGLNGESSSTSYNNFNNIPRIRSYRFKPDVKLVETEEKHLNTPFGSNVGAVVGYNKDLRLQVQRILEGMGYKLLFRPYDVNFEIYHEQQSGFSVSFPFTLVSDTLRRMIFYLAAIESNTDATIVFEEPESNTFPYYIKHLGEKVAEARKDNQFFITTHNPYFLNAVIEKTESEELVVNIVEMEGYETKVTSLSSKGVAEILSLSEDVFLNFDRLKEA